MKASLNPINTCPVPFSNRNELLVCMKGQTAKSKLTEVDHIFAAFNTHTLPAAQLASLSMERLP
jgi:hypothetical protein